MPERIQRKRQLGWRMPQGAVYVGRPSRWGNPFRAGSLFQEPGPWESPCVPYDGRLSPGSYVGRGLIGEFDYVIGAVRDAAHAVDLYRRYIAFYDDAYAPDEVRAELGGKDLCCWCPAESPCHADVLLEIANSKPVPKSGECMCGDRLDSDGDCPRCIHGIGYRHAYVGEAPHVQ